MARRIRTIKPDWLEDGKMSMASDAARVLSVGLILIADDHGRGRADPRFILGNVFPAKVEDEVESAMFELERIGFVRYYEVRNQTYFEIVNWTKHQRIDKPGKPHIPAPAEEPDIVFGRPTIPAFVYFIQQGASGPVKIGRSWSPDQRLRQLSGASPEPLTMLGTTRHLVESEVHRAFSHLRLNGEWFRADPDLLSFIRESLANVRGSLAPDQDQDQDQDQEGTRKGEDQEGSKEEGWVPGRESSDGEGRAPAPAGVLPGGGKPKKVSARRAAKEELETFLEWFNERNGRRFQVRDELVTWVQRLLKLGYDQNDLRIVAEHKRIEWGDDEKMRRHVSPTTLLRPTNFERYIDVAREAWEKERPRAVEKQMIVPDGKPFDLSKIFGAA